MEFICLETRNAVDFPYKMVILGENGIRKDFENKNLEDMLLKGDKFITLNHSGKMLWIRN